MKANAVSLGERLFCGFKQVLLSVYAGQRGGQNGLFSLRPIYRNRVLLYNNYLEETIYGTIAEALHENQRV